MSKTIELKQIPAAALLLSSTGVIEDTNKGFCEILRVEINELVGQSLFRFMSAIEAERLSATLQHISDNENAKVEIQLNALAGSRLTLELQISKIDSVPPAKYLILVSNITHYRRVTEELKEQRRLFKTLIQNLPGVVYRCRWDHEFTVEFISSHSYEMLGYKPDELIGNKKVSFNSLIRIDFREAVHQKWNEAVKNQSTFLFEYPIVTASGEERWLWEQGVGVYDSNKNLVALEGILIDITERKLALESLKRSEELFRMLVENAFDGIYLMRNQKFEYVNQRFADIVGYSANELCSNHFHLNTLFCSNSWALVEKNLGLIENNNEVPTHFDLQVVTQKGVSKDVEVSIAVLSSGKEKMLLGVVRDIDDKKQSQQLIRDSEEKLKKQNEQYLRLNQELIETNERVVKINADLLEAKRKAEEHDKLKSAFLANMSHEIRTPMNGIIGFSQLLVNKELSNEERDEYLDIIQKSGHQLLAIINDLLDISKIEANQITLNPKKVDINELINEQYMLFSSKAQNCSLALEYYIDSPDAKLLVEVDDTRLRQVFSHIIGNAFKFTKQGVISFGYHLRNSMIEFYVQDSGVGIPEGMQHKIFDRFRQVETDLSRQAGGTGLGLSISKALVNKMGGNIWVESIPSQGSTFYFTIPYKKADISSSDSATPELAGEKPMSNYNIIIADDNEVNYLYLKQLLKKTDANFLWAVNGKEVVDLVKSKGNIHLILMDIKMPVMDGYQATRLVKKINPDIRIIAQTAYAMPGDMEDALEAGCDDYISKPINRERLREIISKFLILK